MPARFSFWRRVFPLLVLTVGDRGALVGRFRLRLLVFGRQFLRFGRQFLRFGRRRLCFCRCFRLGFGRLFGRRLFLFFLRLILSQDGDFDRVGVGTVGTPHYL